MSKMWQCVILALACANVFAQQRPQYAQYLQNNFLINPALAGLESYADIRIGYRKQWVGLTSSPTTYYLTGHLPIGNPEFERYTSGRHSAATPRFVPTHRRLFTLPERHFGLGFSIVRDQTGPLSSTTFDIAAAYHYPIADDWQLSTGLSGGLTQYALDFDNIRLKNPIDPLISQGKAVVFKPNLNVGLWLYSPNFFTGFAIQQLVAGTLKFKGSSQDWTGQLVSHYFLTIGGRLELTDQWAFVPSVLLKKSNNTLLSFDLNLKIDYQNQFWGAVSYRNQDALVTLLGLHLGSSLSASYVYEYPIFKTFTTTGSHEIMLGYTIGARIHSASPRNFW